MANKLKLDKQEQVISYLVEGNSIRSTERMTGVHRDTIIRLMIRVGNGSKHLMDEKLRNLTPSHIQVDEIWGFVGKKQKYVNEDDDPNKVGYMWTYVSLDADTKLVPNFLVGKRTSENTTRFMNDLSSRLDSRVQLSSDKLKLYVNSVWDAFGPDVDYAQIVKSYEAVPSGAGRYSPPRVVSVDKRRVYGKPNSKYISTSYVERQNLTMRMGIRRFTRLTNAFSKKHENLEAAVALWFGYYNFVRLHRTLNTAPAVKAGIMKRRWNLNQFLRLLSRKILTEKET